MAARIKVFVFNLYPKG